MVIELDGGQHSEQVAYDSERTAWLEEQGFSILRFWNNEVLKETEAVKEVILKVLDCRSNTPLLNPPPQGAVRGRFLGFGRFCHYFQGVFECKDNDFALEIHPIQETYPCQPTKEGGNN